MQQKDSNQLARNLGWLSIALGITEILAAKPLSNWLESPKKEKLLQATGTREIICGAGLLLQENPKWAWARLAGDGMDLALLGTTMKTNEQKRMSLGFAALAVAGIAILDAACVKHLSEQASHKTATRAVPRETMTINGTIKEVKQKWEEFPYSLPSPYEREINFYHASPGRGTIVSVNGLDKKPPQNVREVLRHFKQWFETGEILTTQGQASGRTRSLSVKYDRYVA